MMSTQLRNCAVLLAVPISAIWFREFVFAVMSTFMGASPFYVPVAVVCAALKFYSVHEHTTPSIIS